MGILGERLYIPKSGRAGVLKTRFPNWTTGLLFSRLCADDKYPRSTDEGLRKGLAGTKATRI